MQKIEIGIIGGSGLYEMEGLTGKKEVKLSTPFGPPSDAYIVGKLEGRRVAFLARHGRGHRILPSEINFRANIWGMKKLGVERIISVSAVGSMKESIAPGQVVVPDQFYDHTRRRIGTFFGGGVVAHVAFADPVCSELRPVLCRAGRSRGAVMHDGGTYFCIEGPQFSARGESLIFRRWGVDVIGMTNVTEAKLAREAEICYATLALVTDYDCWHESMESVTVEAVIETLKKNVVLSQQIIRAALPDIPVSRGCPCGSALKNAIMTPPALIPKKTRENLKLILGDYLSPRTKKSEKK
ncbi:MAG: S-methyl-5'-thioadenosine phosphorylase [Nitrospirae bacterium]|nr:S-methyl-5'-thioadenosine phosphorylase [Nitrospirota bacterium]